MKISTIIATKNAFGLIDSTIRSVNSQTFPSIELIVYDSCSTDGTAEYLKSISTKIDKLVIEQDNGIYHAWNKACLHISGDWVHFLGAGDILYDEYVYDRMAKYLNSAYPLYEMVYGDIALVSPRTKQIVELISKPYSEMRNSWDCGRPATPVHPEVFMHASILKNNDPFDCSYKYAADLKLMLQSLRRKEPLYVGICVDKMLLGGMSSNMENYIDGELERRRLVKELNIKVPILVRFFNFIKFNVKLFIFKSIGQKWFELSVRFYRYIHGKKSYF